MIIIMHEAELMNYIYPNLEVGVALHAGGRYFLMNNGEIRGASLHRFEQAGLHTTGNQK